MGRRARIAAALANQPSLAALLVYLGFSALLFGRAAAPHFTAIYPGRGRRARRSFTCERREDGISARGLAHKAVARK